MTTEEAIEQMELLGHDFSPSDATDSSLQVVYRRRDGGYGLLQPERLIRTRARGVGQDLLPLSASRAAPQASELDGRHEAIVVGRPQAQYEAGKPSHAVGVT